MNRARLYINIKLLLLAVLTLNLSGCELDERVDDLTGGYEGAFIDRLTGEKVATEYYGPGYEHHWGGRFISELGARV